MPGCAPKEQKSEGKLAVGYGTYDNFVGMRKTLLEVNPADFEAAPAGEGQKVFGMMMDWNQGDSISSVTAFRTGDGSLYYSTGLLLMGGIQVERFRQMAKDLVGSAQRFLGEAQPAPNQDLPTPGMVRFYLITHQGTFYQEEKQQSLLQHESKWAELFDSANQFAAAYREAVTPKEHQ